MALLHMCMTNDMDVIAAHVNYHHRKEADEEERYIRSFCEEHLIPLFVRNESFVYTGNFEAAAREWRYDFFCALVKENGCKGVLVAHQEDDLLETYIMQKEKGIIPSYYGLKEELMYQQMLVKRPLLSYTKRQLEEYCDTENVKYYIDHTNEDEALTRNRIRHQIVEKMTGFERKMILKEIRQENAVMQEKRCRIKAYVQQDQMNLKQYRALDESDRYTVLRQMIEKEHPVMRLKRIQQIDHILCTKNDFLIPLDQNDLVQENGYFFLNEKSESYHDVYENANALQESRKKYYMIAEGKCGIFALTLTEEDFPVIIRSPIQGDTISMRFGKKKINRFLIDRKIPLYRRKTWPVIENQKHEVIFVSGLGCDKSHYTVNPTCNVIEYCLLKGDFNDVGKG